MRKTTLTIFISLIASSSVFAQDGLAIGAGYRGFLNRIFMNENVRKEGNPEYMCPQNGMFIFADYNCEKLLGPIDLNVGIDIARLWFFYVRGAHDEFPPSNNNLATLDMQIPLRFRWTFNLAENYHMFIQAGPVFDLGLTLKDGIRSNVDNYSTRINLFRDGTYNLDAGPDVFNRTNPRYVQCDCFIGGGLGFIFNDAVRLMINADWGCVNKLASPGDFEKDLAAKGVTTKNSHNVQLNVSLAYCFD